MLIPAKGFETPAEQACDELYCKAEPRSQQVSMLSSQGAICVASLRRPEQWQICHNREQSPGTLGTARRYYIG